MGGHHCCRCAMWGIVVAVIVPCGCRSCCLCAVWGVVVIAPCGGPPLWSLCHVGHHSRGSCTTWGVAVTVVAPRGCRGCSHCTIWVSWSLSLHCVGVAADVVTPCGVSRSLHYVGCRHRSHCTMWGVAVAVVAPCRVSLSLLLCHMQCCGWGERMATHLSAREVEGGRVLHSEVEKI